MSTTVAEELGGKELWRRQRARNLMDCYALGMEVLAENPNTGGRTYRTMESLMMLMVDGMTSVRSEEDERSFYRMAAELCGVCAQAGGHPKSEFFKIYGALFAELAREEGSHE